MAIRMSNDYVPATQVTTGSLLPAVSLLRG
jgi:hypothetical protein